VWKLGKDEVCLQSVTGMLARSNPLNISEYGGRSLDTNSFNLYFHDGNRQA
jgi:hypothetical protein